MGKAEASGHSLSYRDTCLVKGMLARDDRQHDIAAYFKVNAGRISEVAAGDNPYPNATPTHEDQLPPPGPYLTKFALSGVIDAFNEAIEALNLAEAEEAVEDVKAALVLARDTLIAKMESLQEA